MNMIRILSDKGNSLPVYSNLSQLIGEVPAPHRKRVNRWLRCYAVATRLTVVPTA